MIEQKCYSFQSHLFHLENLFKFLGVIQFHIVSREIRYVSSICILIVVISGLPQHTKNRENSEVGGGGHRLVGLLVGALTAATVLAGTSVAFVMARRRRLIQQISRRSRSASFQECTADKPHLPPAIHLTVSLIYNTSILQL